MDGTIKSTVLTRLENANTTVLSINFYKVIDANSLLHKMENRLMYLYTKNELPVTVWWQFRVLTVCVDICLFDEPRQSLRTGSSAWKKTAVKNGARSFSDFKNKPSRTVWG